MKMKRTFLLAVVLAVAAWSSAAAEETRTNAPPAGAQPTLQGVIQITDSGWTTATGTSDCVSGAADDTWELTLTQIQELTVTVQDCCCPGDYFEVFVDGEMIGTTPNLAPPWGCDFSGPLSTGSFKKVLCPGVHTIQVRDAGFDGHSQTEIADQNMCPAGFTVSGSLAPPPPPPPPEDATPQADLGPVPAPSPEVQALMNQVTAIEPFVGTDERGFQRLDAQGARRAGIAQESVVLGQRMVALHNRIIAAARAGNEAPLQRHDFAFIEPLFLHQAQTGHPCTDRQNPAPCPARVESGRFFPTEQEVRQHLESLGYHQTAGYAGGGSGRDFTRVVSFPGCSSNGAFRDQAIYRQEGACWTYNTQGPEPNPEFLSYGWPYFGWVGYVRWWHLTFC